MPSIHVTIWQRLLLFVSSGTIIALIGNDGNFDSHYSDWLTPLLAAVGLAFVGLIGLERKR